MSFSEQYPISDETLMGFILEALPEEERDYIACCLLRDPTLVQRIVDLRELLNPIDLSKDECFEPSPDLLARTMAQLDSSSASHPAISNETSESVSAFSQIDTSESTRKDTKLAWMDSLVTIAAGITLICFLTPSVWYSREQARKNVCAENLRGIGGAFQEFANSNSLGEFPCIEMSGPFAFAGVYALKLKNAELLDSANRLKCPSSTVAQIVLRIPTYKEYLTASADEQTAWQRTMGGNYAYNLGNLVSGTYVTPRISDGGVVPLIGDAVCIDRLNSDCKNLTHGFDSVNLLYSDGRVLTVRVSECSSTPGFDHPYLNRNNLRAVGLGSDDTCLAPSFVAPIIHTMLK